MNTVENALKRADAYIEENKDKANKTYRHQFHLMPPIGWMNDPNGFCRYNNAYHMFYQYYPYGSLWGPMHWGHARSKDMLIWEDLPVALAPGESYDKNGIFSGTAIVVEDELRLYYTGMTDTHLDTVYDENLLKREQPLETADSDLDVSRQVQCFAVSKDGIHFNKYSGNPVIGSSEIPPSGRPEDFRDPKVWQHGDKYYLAAGSKRHDFIGQVLFYESEDGISWKYLNRLTMDKDYGTVWECPDFFELDGRHVLLFSPQDKPRRGLHFENVHSALAFVGRFDYATGSFDIDFTQELDGGFDFYAPQTLLDAEGNRVMMAWMNMWERQYVLDDEKQGWNGSMTLPRTLRIQGDHIYQWPIKAVENYRTQHVGRKALMVSDTFSEPSLVGNVLDMELEFEILEGKSFEMMFLAHDTEQIVLKFDKETQTATLNRMQARLPIISLNARNDYSRSIHLDCSAKQSLRVVLDVSSLEVFFENGRQTMTALFFPAPGSQEMRFRADGLAVIHHLSKWTLTK